MNGLKQASVALATAGLLASGVAQAALIDRGGGLIYDSDLNVVWLQDANYTLGSAYDSIDGTTDGRMRWVNAMAWAENLTFYDSVRDVTYEDWRLPTIGPVNGTSLNVGNSSYDGSTDYGHNISAPGSAYPGSKGSEMAYLFYNGLGNKSYCAVATSCLPAPPQPGWGLLNPGPFLNLNGAYWSDTNQGPVSNDAAVFFVFSSDTQSGLWDSDVGGQLSFSKDGRIHALGLRSCSIRDEVCAPAPAPIPEPETYTLMLLSLGLLGLARRRKQAPV